MDLAVRRRFAFMTLMPARQVLVDQNCPEAALAAFDWLTDVFVEFAPDEALTSNARALVLHREDRRRASDAIPLRVAATH